MHHIVKLTIDNTISVCFYIDHDEVMAIGQKMQEINPEAYMNGYNWEVFLIHYLAETQPDLLKNMEGDSEAGTCVFVYKASPHNNQRADKLCLLIKQLLANPKTIYAFLKAEGDNVEWD